MAILVINGEDYSERLTSFSLTCKCCSGTNVELEVDWAAYPSAAWCKLTTICKDCFNDETIYET